MILISFRYCLNQINFAVSEFVTKSVGPFIETWRFFNPWVKSVKFGSLAYDSDAMLDISMEIRYDFAQFTKA